MKDVLISTSKGYITVKANRIKDGLAVHRVYDLLDKTSHKHEGIYTVTHLQSGLSCYAYHINYKQACKLMDMLLALAVDWQKDKDYITNHKPIILEQLRLFGQLKDNGQLFTTDRRP